MAADDILWKIFSYYIRLRDADDNGYCTCFTCGRYKFWRDGDAGHGIGRQHWGCRYNERNVHFQCKHCNGFEGGKREAYQREMDRRYGAGTWDLMELASKKPSKRFSTFEIEALKAHYMNEYNKLAKQKGQPLVKITGKLVA